MITKNEADRILKDLVEDYMPENTRDRAVVLALLDGQFVTWMAKGGNDTICALLAGGICTTFLGALEPDKAVREADRLCRSIRKNIREMAREKKKTGSIRGVTDAKDV